MEKQVPQQVDYFEQDAPRDHTDEELAEMLNVKLSDVKFARAHMKRQSARRRRLSHSQQKKRQTKRRTAQASKRRNR